MVNMQTHQIKNAIYATLNAKHALKAPQVIAQVALEPNYYTKVNA
jgi:hypothetical protein